MGEQTSYSEEERGVPPSKLPERELEAIKLRYDMFKHLTTMCSGAIVLTLSVVAGLFPKPQVVVVFGVSIIFFLVGAVVSALVMRDIVHDLDDADNRLRRTNTQFYAWAAFYAGLFSFGAFALYNFFKG